MPLNQQLYDLLCQRFGAVSIANEGDAMTSRYAYDPIKGKTVLDIAGWGESYYINCPFCSDTRKRLSINHRYGVHDPFTESDNLFLARCFNEDCLKAPGRYRDLKEMVFGFMNRDQRRQLLVVHEGTRPPVSPESLQQAQPPGEVVEVADLAPDHPALAYLRQRGFDPVELSSVWHVMYCTQAAPTCRLAQDRIVIPIIMNGTWVGWQARRIEEQDSGPTGRAKYLTMPGLPKRLVLYNHDEAKQQPALVVCEGVSDVWRVGRAGVALLGKQASQKQLALLAGLARTRPLVVLLDGDAKAEADRLVEQLRPFVRQGLVQVSLPEGRDPGSYGRDEVWSLIREQASEQGCPLPDPVGTTPHSGLPAGREV